MSMKPMLPPAVLMNILEVSGPVTVKAVLPPPGMTVIGDAPAAVIAALEDIDRLGVLINKPAPEFTVSVMADATVILPPAPSDVK